MDSWFYFRCKYLFLLISDKNFSNLCYHSEWPVLFSFSLVLSGPSWILRSFGIFWKVLESPEQFKGPLCPHTYSHAWVADFPAVFFHICHGTQQAVVTAYREPWVHQYKYKYWINQGASNMLVFCADDVTRWTLYLCSDMFFPSRFALWPWLSLHGPAWDWWFYIRDVYQLNFSPVSLVCNPPGSWSRMARVTICPGLDHHRSMKLVFFVIVIFHALAISSITLFRT